jgi:hypothetical protein
MKVSVIEATLRKPIAARGNGEVKHRFFRIEEKGVTSVQLLPDAAWP